MKFDVDVLEYDAVVTEHYPKVRTSKKKRRRNQHAATSGGSTTVILNHVYGIDAFKYT